MQIIFQKNQTIKVAMITALASLSLSSQTLADEPKAEQDTSQSTTFIMADENDDNMLTREEFQNFVAFQADAGEADYAAIKEDGSEDLHFSGKDIDGDGLLTRDELSYSIILPENTGKDIPAYGSGDAPKTPDENATTAPETGG